MNPPLTAAHGEVPGAGGAQVQADDQPNRPRELQVLWRGQGESSHGRKAVSPKDPYMNMTGAGCNQLIPVVWGRSIGHPYYGF